MGGASNDPAGSDHQGDHQAAELGAGSRDYEDQCPACATATAQGRTLGHVGGDGPARRAAARQRLAPPRRFVSALKTMKLSNQTFRQQPARANNVFGTTYPSRLSRLYSVNRVLRKLPPGDTLPNEMRGSVFRRTDLPDEEGLKARRSFSPWKMPSMSTNGRSRSGLPKPANAPHSGFRVPPCLASGQVAGFKPRHRAAQPLDQPPDLPRTDRSARLWSASHHDLRCLA